MNNLSFSDLVSVTECLFTGIMTVIAIITFFRDKK